MATSNVVDVERNGNGDGAPQYVPLFPEPGRRRLTLPDLRDLIGTNDHRIRLLNDLDQFLAAAKHIMGVPICAIWISGTCLTDKELPDDIDVVLILNEDDVNNFAGRKLPPISDHVLQKVATEKGMTLADARRLIEHGQRRGFTQHGLRQMAERRGLRIDAYVMAWRPRPEVAAIEPEDLAYLQDRGYWDDFWLRLRSVPKGHTPTRKCALPRRGYVEVIIDDFV